MTGPATSRAAADPSFVALEVEQCGDHEPELDDNDRGEESDDLFGLQLGHVG